MKPTKEQILEQIHWAFREYLLTRVKVTRRVAEAMWEDFQQSLVWRIDNLYKGGEKT